MDIYTLLRILVHQIQPKIRSPEMDRTTAILRASALDLIAKLEATQALGTLASQLEGEILNVFMPDV